MLKKLTVLLGSAGYTGGQSIESIVADYMKKPHNWEQGALSYYL